MNSFQRLNVIQVQYPQALSSSRIFVVVIRALVRVTNFNTNKTRTCVRPEETKRKELLSTEGKYRKKVERGGEVAIKRHTLLP